MTDLNSEMKHFDWCMKQLSPALKRGSRVLGDVTAGECDGDFGEGHRCIESSRLDEE